MNIVEENWEQILNKMKLEYCSFQYFVQYVDRTTYRLRSNR